MADYIGTDGNDSYYGTKLSERIEGLGGDDYLLGNGGDDEILGGNGDDNLHGGEGNDTIDGGEGDDGLQGDEGADTLRGGPGNDNLYGESGTDTIYGEGGNDTIRGSFGDLLYGGEGDDTFDWSHDALIDGGAGNDHVRFYYVIAGIDLTAYLSDPGVETQVLGTRIIGIESMSFSAGSGNDRLTGGSGDDELTGNAGDDVLIGGAGNDALSGGEGVDHLSGGAGDDRLLSYGDVGVFADVSDGGEGFDMLEFNAANSSVEITIDLLATSGMVTNVEQLWFLSFGSGSNHVSGGSAADLFSGGSGADFFDGREGDDDIRANGGDDVVHGGGGRDFIEGGNGANRLYGGEGNDIVRGGGVEANLVDGEAGDDEVEGGAGADTIYGGTGDDWLRGNEGNDTIDGGTGTDTAVYNGNRDQYSVTSVSGGFRITDNRDGWNDGEDIVSGVELFLFADGELSAKDVLAPILPSDQWRLYTQSGFSGEIGGHGQVFGTNASQDIAVLNRPGSITFDGSFNRGGDLVRFEGDASNWKISLSGSSAVFSDADTFVVIPVGIAGMAIEFADGIRSLQYNPASATVMFGGQSVSSSPEAISVAADGTAVAPDLDPNARSNLVLSQGGEVVAGGNLNIFGTSGNENVELTKGDVTLDGSFNRGGNGLTVAGAPAAFLGRIEGSSV
ncbi:calcium-binding protein [Novosphingobium album (ex Liu et al. 2023)]|uniref:Calcium-binding protein n=1 Tax=Novosphingobium album (ex Liu et al. 2023) TaxID=3031130 RepID=A0ABT5WU84_9SPHN|nr:calcium-binding protein [Novosphingobium album (ex Liu et al. 2023)]MDE8653429.1 calcium-binding protein [Novosphingobium album (ex Liu et al. 2023)]